MREALLDSAITAFHTMLVQPARSGAGAAGACPRLLPDRRGRSRPAALRASYWPATCRRRWPPTSRDFLNQIRARKRWSFSTWRFALAPDSNIGGSALTSAPSTSSTCPSAATQEELTTSGIGVSLWGGAEYQHAAGRPAAAPRRVRTSRGGSMSAPSSINSSSASHVGPRWLVDRDTAVSLLAERPPDAGSAPRPISRELGARFEVGRRVSPAGDGIRGSASWHGRRYRTRARSHLDGPVWDASLRGAWVVTPTVRADAFCGGYARERPSSNSGVSGTAAAGWARGSIVINLPLGLHGGRRRRVSAGEL